MDSQKVGPIMTGVVVENKQNNRGMYDGIIETSNYNKYHFFNNDTFLTIGMYYNFNMATSNINNCDFIAINIVPF
jgi:hypothetical protein